uniref:Retrotransposon protein, putative, Ty1-copia subclass n=1 Tax=Tanacetum cinerariifolium TaxID=118510 RepID=A0A6L2L2B9_TANCI|nr:retrotransposon protein, putative, Ty1-copia subclass [Tanacetum cinerariifolium]
MAQPIQKINHLAFRLMFEREKLFRANFNDWFRSLKLVLRVEKKMFVIEQPIPPAPPADSAPQVLADFKNSSPCDMLHELKFMFEKQARVERVYLKRLLHHKRWRYKVVESRSLTRNHKKLKGKGKGKGRGMNKPVYIPKPKNPEPSANEHPTKNDTCHHCKEVGHWKRNCHVYLTKLIKKKKQVGITSSSGKMTRKPFPYRIERAIDLLRLIHTDVCGPLRHVSRQGASYFITFMNDYSRYGYVYLLKHKHEFFETFKVFKNEVENQLGNTINAFQSDRRESGKRILNMVPTKKVVKTPYELWCIFVGYPKETMGYYFYFPPKNKSVVARYAEFLEKNTISQDVSGRVEELE